MWPAASSGGACRSSWQGRVEQGFVRGSGPCGAVWPPYQRGANPVTTVQRADVSLSSGEDKPALEAGNLAPVRLHRPGGGGVVARGRLAGDLRGCVGDGGLPGGDGALCEGRGSASGEATAARGIHALMCALPRMWQRSSDLSATLMPSYSTFYFGVPPLMVMSVVPARRTSQEDLAWPLPAALAF